MNSITTISAYGDNYIYLYRYGRAAAFVVDPGQSAGVLRALESQGLSLSSVLVTHNHFDHVGGVEDLKSKTGCRVVGPDKNRIVASDRVLADADLIELGETTIRVIATPGHTAKSVCYYVLPAENRSGILFTGDTMFIAGCGRLLECDARTMWNSLQKIAALPDDTLIYPGHNYTQENYEFALTIEPNNEVVKTLLEAANFAPPSSIAREKQTNVFLRASTPQIKKALAMPTASDAETFAHLRQRKNIFR